MWTIRTCRSEYSQEKEPRDPEWISLQPHGEYPEKNEDIEATEQTDGSLLILDVSSNVKRIVIDHHEDR
jgi:hypothetical protein